MIALDIETTGLSVDSTIVGVGIYSEKGSKYISNPTAEDFNYILSTATSTGRGFVMHNGVFDCSLIWHNFNIDFAPYIKSDTRLLAHLVDENSKLSLDSLAKQYLNDEKQIDKLRDSVVENGGKWLKHDREYYKADDKVLAEYCLHDAKLTYYLHKRLYDMLDNKLKKLYEEETMPLYRLVTIPMRYHGVVIDVEYLEQLKAELELSIEEKEEYIYKLIKNDVRELEDHLIDEKYKETKQSKYGKKVKELFGEFIELPKEERIEIKRSLEKDKHIFNINSNKHLGWLIFHKYGEKVKKISKLSGLPVVDAATLESMRHIEFVDKLLELRKEKKLLSTYVKPMLEKRIGDKLFVDMDQVGTTSGRFSARAPNLQNLPAGDTRIRRAIIAPKGYKIVNADFSSLEPRCFAEMSRAESLKSVFKNTEDLYSRIAIDVFGLKNVSAKESDSNYLKKVNPEYRQKMKVISLAVVYGARAKKIAKILNIEPVEAQKIIDKYLNTYPELKNYMERQERLMLDNFEVESILGLKRRAPEVGRLQHSFDKDDYFKLIQKLNLAKNHPIQSLAAHICNRAMINIAKDIKKYNAYIVLQVHDSITVYAPEEHVEKVAELVKKHMEHNEVTELIDVPMHVEPEIMDNLEEGH